MTWLNVKLLTLTKCHHNRDLTQTHCPFVCLWTGFIGAEQNSQMEEEQVWRHKRKNFYIKLEVEHCFQGLEVLYIRMTTTQKKDNTMADMEHDFWGSTKLMQTNLFWKQRKTQIFAASPKTFIPVEVGSESTRDVCPSLSVALMQASFFFLIYIQSSKKHPEK